MILAFDGAGFLDVAGPSEAFAVADALAMGGRYRVTIASPDGRDVVSSSGLRMGVDAPAAEVDPIDTVLVPGGWTWPWASRDAVLLDSVRDVAARSRRVAGVCVGTFLLAATDLLDGIAADPAGDHRLSSLGRRAGFSERHLTRLFSRELGTSPGRYVEQVRIEAARALLETSDAPLGAIARDAGLGTAETLRRAFQRTVGVTPDAYRRHFVTTGVPAAR